VVVIRRAGFSLIELMLSLALGALVVIAIVQLFVASNAGNALLGGQARLQESSRAALEIIGHSVRNAGFYGCAADSTAIRVGLAGRGDEIFEFDVSRPAQAVSGGDGLGWHMAVAGNGGLPPAAAISGDVLVVRSLGVPQARLARALEPDGDPVVARIGSEQPFRVDDIVLLSDCEQGALFRVTGIVADGDDVALQRAPQSGGGPFANAEPPIPLSRNGRPYGTDALIAPLWSTAFYVAASRIDVNAAGTAVPALWMKEGPRAPVELVAGVEQLDVYFGVDRTPDDQASRVHRWLPYVQVQAPDRIVAVRVSLTVNSIDAVGAEDGMLRRTFSETFMLRNLARP
jgi:type IV pilus assembly protein PilW